MLKSLVGFPLSLKIVLSTGIILAIGILSSDWFLFQKSEQMLMQSAWESIQRSIKQQSERVTLYLDDARDDAILLSHSPAIRQYLENKDESGAPISEALQRRYKDLLAQQFSELIEARGYLQIRLIDLESGMELVRVDRPGPDQLLPAVVPDDQLQNKLTTLYVRTGATLKPNQVHISNINLNREYGKIVVPYQPTQRFVVGIFDEDGLTESNESLSLNKLAQYIVRFDIELTKAAVRVAQTGNMEWWEHYNYIAPRLDLALERAKGYVGDNGETYIDTINEANIVLVDIENQVFELASLGLTDEAESLLTSDRYAEQKRVYKSAVDDLVDLLKKRGDQKGIVETPSAIVVINTNFQDVISSFEAIQTHETVLTNQKGQFLYHPDERKRFAFESDRFASKLSDEEPIVWDHLTKGVKEHASFDHHGEMHVSQRVFFDDVDSNKFVGLVLTKQKTEVIGPIIELGRFAILIALAAISCSIVLIFIIVKVQTRPITQLTADAQRIMDGGLDEKMSGSTSHDEVGQLKQVFSDLVDQLQQQIRASQDQSDEIQSLNKDLEKRISERTAKLEQATQEAQSASTAKSEFLATMSHEIRTPMNGMMGMAQLLGKTSLNEQQQEYVSTINRSGDALLTIINDILDFSKIESGKLEIEPIDFDLKSLVQDALQLMENRAREKHLKLDLEFDPNIPDFYTGDPGRIRQVLLNLIGNAIKFTPKGGVKLRVEGQELGTENYRLKVSVVDSGIGIPIENQAKLFEAFHQADNTTTRNFGGTGLGLAICKRLVELMGGFIGFESEVGFGSEFWFSLTLPASSRQAVEGLVQTRDGVGEDESEDGNHLTGLVLLVEDNAVNQLVAKSVLERSGLEVDIAENGIEAIEKWRDNSYDLILMDCLMPEMDGFEATRQIRSLETDQRIPIIALTANVMAADRAACKAAGMDDFLGKPVQFEVMTETLKRWLN